MSGGCTHPNAREMQDSDGKKYTKCPDCGDTWGS